MIHLIPNPGELLPVMRGQSLSCYSCCKVECSVSYLTNLCEVVSESLLTLLKSQEIPNKPFCHLQQPT
ncbi:hypothetical protein I7I50_12071 [Histoplasma capsulatum G186AR]|uniref:Uncharacterized protein n=1 Tax=Ajellomyces capsulatus TaxID=5037 RepID=A0A8H7YDB3_AJECA|nr:hypothetical protein I7I52_11617 [Histoplasma capsulatum]QSS70441.1 hypothetical protein I7I50_12071 [Histoplasma capsulatum G186AR]